MPIELDSMPSEGTPLVGERRYIHDVLDEPVELDLVVIHDRDYVVDLVIRAEHGRFPDLSFLTFAVAQHHVSARRAVVEAGGAAHPESERETLAEGTGGCLERWDKTHIRMSLIDGSELAQGFELILGSVARLGEHRVEDRARVTLRQDKAVALGPLGVGGVVPHDAAEEQRHQDFDGGERSPRVAGFGGSGHFDNVAT